MSIYPTRLYVKRHRKTGLKYFGKTTTKNIYSYSGSGKYWKRHIKEHGKDIETLWVSEYFLDNADLVDFSILFSELFDIASSNEWANLIAENGLDGAPRGYPKPEGFRLKFLGEKNPMFGMCGDKNPFSGKTHSTEQKRKWSEMRLGDKNPNYGGKAFTEETLYKLRRPKSKKENYKGSPGKITCINRNGIAIQITTDLYNKQKESGLPVADWEFVSTRSKEAEKRRQFMENK